MVQLLPPNETVEIADYTELVNTLNEVVIYGKDDSYKEYDGQAVIYTITVNGGKVITVNAYNPFIIVDGIGYKTKYEFVTVDRYGWYRLHGDLTFDEIISDYEKHFNDVDYRAGV